MKKHIIAKEISEGVVKTACNLLVMRYDGIKERYLPARLNEVTCGRCQSKNSSRDRKVLDR